MSVGIGKKSNEYADAIADIDASKTVFMALAFSLAMRLCSDNEVAARKMLLDEWTVLHANGIVPQPVRVAQ